MLDSIFVLDIYYFAFYTSFNRNVFCTVDGIAVFGPQNKIMSMFDPCSPNDKESDLPQAHAVS